MDALYARRDDLGLVKVEGGQFGRRRRGEGSSFDGGVEFVPVGGVVGLLDSLSAIGSKGNAKEMKMSQLG
jgi:hypothetical protein